MMTNIVPHTPQPMSTRLTSLSGAWSETFLYILDHAGKRISPLIVSIDQFDSTGAPIEDPALRHALDATLEKEEHQSVEDVAFTIFPQRFWTMARGDRQALYRFYRMAFPAYQAWNAKLNRKGLYFERMVNYGRGPCDGNQLEWIITQYKKRSAVRRSMLQAAIFDPEHDHVPDAQLVFPCLQQISFEPTPSGLVVNAFYATQQLFNKAYGNYLGLARLGAFIAHELDMPMARLNVVAGIEKLEKVPKTSRALDELKKVARECVQKESAPGAKSTRTETVVV